MTDEVSDRLVWWKSSRSHQNGACVEVARDAQETIEMIIVRDSKAPAAGMLRFPVPAWGFFLAGLKAGEFD